jgi:tetratricopeptide (TPR) repeat protein
MAEPLPFQQALDSLRRRGVLPTSLSTADIERLPQWIRDQAFFSARVAQAEILDGMMTRIDTLLGGGERGPGLGMDPALFRVEMRQLLDSVSYAPTPDDAGTIKDLRSEARLNVIVRTQEQMATGHGQYLQSTDPEIIDLYPAWELIRLRDSRVKRDWTTRWSEAAGAVGDTDALRMLSEQGRMIARKDSPIWTQLSRFGRPHPPFDFNSGMDVEDVDRTEALASLGGMLRMKERHREAVAAYDRAIARVASPERRHWLLFYARGIACERSDRWPCAEADFKRALDLMPEQPDVLNYLAYSWVDRGLAEHYDRALAMLQRAVELRPNSGHIIDSLAWALYKLGRYAQAVPLLERAVELLPQEAVILDHLGDAYWRVGRRLEARYQWQRALGAKPEPDLKPQLERKLEGGLPDAASGGG